MRLAAALFALCLIVPPAAAQSLTGTDDPAFAEPFARALAGDDPTALAEIHAAAEAGNIAALLALPAVLQWLRPNTGTLAERKRFNSVNGQNVIEAVAAADPVAALWANGDFSRDMPEQLDRVTRLYAAGEMEKANMLFMGWLNQTGGYTELPKGFFDLPAPDWTMAILLRGRLHDTFYGTAREAETLAYNRLKAGDPAADIALAGYSGLHRYAGAEPVDPALPARALAIYAAAGIQKPEAQARMEATIPLMLTVNRQGPPGDPAFYAAAAAGLADDPSLAALSGLCATACPETANACTTAWLMGLGAPIGHLGTAQPLVSLIPAAEFYKTPRNRLILTRNSGHLLGEDPAHSPALAAMRAVDACLADTILASLPAK